MALVRCRECDRRISDRASSCPGCGCPVTESGPSHVVVEQTGRGLKGRYLAWSSIALFGVACILVTYLLRDSGLGVGPLDPGETRTLIGLIGFLGVMIGGVGMLWTKVEIWWRHG